jgi:hypothetical protein
VANKTSFEKSSSCAYSFDRYIEVKTPELAKKIIEAMHRSDIRGRQIIVREVCLLDILFNFYVKLCDVYS